MFQVTFQFVELTRKWDVFVHGAETELEARQGFNAVILTTRQAIPELAFNRAKIQPDGSYKINVGFLSLPKQQAENN